MLSSPPAASSAPPRPPLLPTKTPQVIRNARTPLKCNADGLWKGPTRLFVEERAWPTFNFRTFGIEFLRQVLFPFTLPLFVLRDRGLARGQHYFTPKLGWVFLHHIAQPLGWATLIWTIIRLDHLRAAGVGMSEAIGGFVFVSAHRLCVAIKYAFLSESEYEEFRQAPAQQQHRWLSGMQLLSAWMNPNLPTIAFEVWMAARQLNLDTNTLFVRLDDSSVATSRRFQEFVTVTDSKAYTSVVDDRHCKNTSTRMSLLQLTVGTFKRAVSPTFIHCVSWVTLIVGVLRALLFCGVRGLSSRSYRFGPFGDTYEAMAMSLCQIVISLAMYRVVLLLLFGGVVDTARRLTVVTDVGDFARITEEQRFGHPMLNLRYLQNVRCWIAMRRMVQRIGYRFMLRAQIYGVVAQLIVVASVLYLLFLVLESEDPTQLGSQANFVQAVTDLVVFSTPMFLLLFFGARVNERQRVDKESMVSHRVKTRMRLLEHQRLEASSVSGGGGDVAGDLANDVGPNGDAPQNGAGGGPGLRARKGSVPDEGAVEGMEGLQDVELRVVEGKTNKKPLSKLRDSALSRTWFLRAEYDDAMDDLFDTAIQALDAMDLSSSERVLGMRSDFRNLFTAITVLLSVLAFCFRLVYFPSVSL